MNISAVSFSAPGSIQTGLELAVMSKALDTAEVTGDAISKMLEASVTGLGQHIDLRA